MDPLRTVARAIFAYLYLLLVVRSSDRRMLARRSTVDFVLALVFADVIDNAVWGEVPLSEFVAASATMCAMRAFFMRAGVRATSTQSRS